MTTIRYIKDKDHVRISIHGHAMYNPGNDIVCAAISHHTITMLNILNTYEQGDIITKFSAEAIDGNVTADFHVKCTDIWNNAWLIFRTGYEMLADEYPDHVRLEL